MAFSIIRSPLLLPPLLVLLLLLLITFSSSSHPVSGLGDTPIISGGGGGYGFFPLRRSVAEGSSPAGLRVNNSFVLAAQRTHRRDPLDGFKDYNGGWNISNIHYWASVGFTAAPLFVIAAVWFLVFGLALSIICCRHCCCPRMAYTYSRLAYALSLIMLILFTCASIIGAIVLYSGQEKFHTSTGNTLDYVVSQANVTVDNLRDFADKLGAAKQVGVDQVFLPSDVQGQIDTIVKKVNTSANDLSSRASQNSKNIHDVLDSVRLALIVIAAAMLLLAFLGFLFSILGMKFLVYVLVIVGWILVAGTFILCGVFLLFHNVVADTCVSMEEWVNNPQAHTALDDILPCVDAATANESFYQSRKVTFQLVNVVNNVIVNFTNRNFPPGLFPIYYNQSGPLMPNLCNPYNSNLSNRTCAAGEVDLDNATQVWKGYVCNVKVVNGNDVCTTVGRVTPKIYNQMRAAVSVSYGLYHYGPFLVQLQDCTVVRQTFSSISDNNCPGLRRYSSLVYIGLAMVSAAVMLSLIFWVVYAKERRHRMYGKQFLARSGQSPPVQEKAP